MKIVAFVPIRLNSKRVVGKNLKILGGKPLMRYLLDTLIQVKKVDDIYVFCSSEEITAYLPEGVKFLKRRVELDSDTTLGKDIYEEFVGLVDADIYILAHTTSPFIKASTIDLGLEKIMNEGYDSAFSCEKVQTFAWYKGMPLNYDLKNVPRTQTIEPVYIETSAFFMFKRDVWKVHKQRIGFNPYFAVVDKIEAVDIDYPEDFEFAEEVVEILKRD